MRRPEPLMNPMSECPSQRAEPARVHCCIVFPGFPRRSVSIDTMHTEFLGEIRKHAALFLRTLVSVSGLNEATFCKRLSGHFRKLLRLNGISCKPTFRNLSEPKSLLAFPMLKFVQLFPALVRASEIDLTNERLEPELAAWTLRLDPVDLARTVVSRGPKTCGCLL